MPAAQGLFLGRRETARFTFTFLDALRSKALLIQHMLQTLQFAVINVTRENCQEASPPPSTTLEFQLLAAAIGSNWG